MLEFELEKALIEDVIVKFARQYEINEGLVADVVKMIHDKEYKKGNEESQLHELKTECIKEDYWEESNKKEKVRSKSFQDPEENREEILSSPKKKSSNPSPTPLSSFEVI